MLGLGKNIVRSRVKRLTSLIGGFFISLIGANPQRILIGNAYQELGATSSDGTAVVIDSTNVNTSTLGNYTVTYNATNLQGEVAPQRTRTVSVYITADATAVTADNTLITADTQ